MIYVEVIYTVASQLGRGGVGQVSLKAAEGLKKAGYLKKAVSLGPPNLLGEKQKILPFAPKPPLLPSRLYYAFKNRYFDSFTARFFVEDCDIYHGWNSQALRSLRKARELGARTVVERASTHPVYQYRILKKEFARYGKEPPRYHEDSLKELREADYVTVPCGDVAKKSFLGQGFPGEKIIELPFGVDSDKFRPGGKKDDTFRAVFIGTVSMRKGMPYLLRAWKELEGEGMKAELLVVGPVEPTMQPLMDSYSGKISMRHVKWSDDLGKECGESDIFVFPSLEEGGTTLSQLIAMACGLPCIVTDETKWPVRDGKDGFVTGVRDVGAIKEKISRFYENPESVTKMGRSARKRAEKFTWENYQNELIKFYKRINQ